MCIYCLLSAQKTDASVREESHKDELETLQEQISTLSSSLTTVMEQKSKMEANYQADKRKMMVSTAAVHIVLIVRAVPNGGGGGGGGGGRGGSCFPQRFDKVTITLLEVSSLPPQ